MNMRKENAIGDYYYIHLSRQLDTINVFADEQLKI